MHARRAPAGGWQAAVLVLSRDPTFAAGPKDSNGQSRRPSIAAVAKAVPTGRQEEWRFTPLHPLPRAAGDTVLPEYKVTVRVQGHRPSTRSPSEYKVTVETDPAPGKPYSQARGEYTHGLGGRAPIGAWSA